MKNTQTPNADLISRSALLAVLPNDGTILTDNIRMMVRNAPAVDAEPVRHGRWQFEARGKDGRTELPVCSWCGATPKYYVPKNDVGFQVPPYCSECGCKMDAEVE